MLNIKHQTNFQFFIEFWENLGLFYFIMFRDFFFHLSIVVLIVVDDYFVNFFKIKSIFYMYSNLRYAYPFLPTAVAVKKTTPRVGDRWLLLLLLLLKWCVRAATAG